MQQFTFSRNLEGAGNRTMFLILEEVQEIILDFSQETLRKF